MSAITDRQIQESDKLITALKRHPEEMPFAQVHLELHELLNADLRGRREADDQVGADWKKAIQARNVLTAEYLDFYWDMEADLVDYFGKGDPALIEFVWTETDRLNTPAEVLSVLEKMQAAFANHPDLPFAAEYITALPAAIEGLGNAIQEAERLENATRESARQRKEVEASYRQARAKTKRRLVRHFKAGRYPPQLDEFLGE